jgi:hypothetical protein
MRREGKRKARKFRLRRRRGDRFPDEKAVTRGQAKQEKGTNQEKVDTTKTARQEVEMGPEGEGRRI